MDSSHASVTVYDGSEFAILLSVKKACSNNTYLFIIHKITGSLDFTRMNGHSVFENPESAAKYMDTYYPGRKELGKGIGLIGMNRFGSKLCIILVKNAEKVAYYENKHTIYKVTKTQNLWFDLPFYEEVTSEDIVRINRINDFPVKEFHMFCNTKDISIPIGHVVSKPDFIWNNMFAKPFQDLGVKDACISLVQGCASTQIVTIGEDLVRMTLITLRSAKHGGTRYNARGLNKESFPANEVQCEFILEKSNGKIYSHVLRRGTVPVEWRTDANLASSHIIIEENNSKLSPIYFERLKREYDIKGSYDKSFIVIMNLLHNEEKHPEKKLCLAFENAVSKMSYVKYISFDWHAAQKNNGLPAAVEEYVSLLLDKIDDLTFTIEEPENEISKNDTPTDTMMFANDAELKAQKYVLKERQKSIARVNCLDSLDRTNVGSFWIVCCLVLKYNNVLHKPVTFDDIKGIQLSIRRFLGEAFIQTGNTVSFMYTDTEACMTKIFREFGEISEKAASDSVIAIMRRKKNIFTDKVRDKGIRLFSGADTGKILKGLSYGIDLICASAFPGCFIPPYPGSLKDGSELFKLTRYNISTLQLESCLSKGLHKLQFMILLSKPVYVNALVLQSVSTNSPISVKIKGGLTQKPLIPLSDNFAIPVCPTPTQLIFKIPPDICNGNYPLARIILLSFKAPSSVINVSNIFVFGSEKPIPIRKIEYPETYADLNFIRKDDYWPRIRDTSPLNETISMYRTPSLDNAINIEISRLHHRYTKLKTISTLFMHGHNPQEFSITSFKLKSNNEISKHNCTSSVAGEPTWRCYTCGNTFCPNCSDQHVMEPCVLLEESCFLCDTCFKKFQEVEEKFRNLYRFYSCYNRLHFPAQECWEKWFTANMPENRNSLLYFPRTAFILASESDGTASPDVNLVLTPRGGCIVGTHSFQIAFGVCYSITKIIVDGSDDIMIKIHPFGSSGIIANDEICTIDKNHKEVGVSMRTNFLLVYLDSGTLRSIKFEGEPYITHLDVPKPIEEPLPKLPNPISRRANVSTEASIVFKFNRNTKISGIIYEKFIGASGIVVSFTEKDSNNESESEYFYLPSGIQDFATYFKKKHKATTVRVYITDKTPLLQSARISLF